jgi:hypothetical protein
VPDLVLINGVLRKKLKYSVKLNMSKYFEALLLEEGNVCKTALKKQMWQYLEICELFILRQQENAKSFWNSG